MTTLTFQTSTIQCKSDSTNLPRQLCLVAPVLSRQCLERRIPDIQTFSSEIAVTLPKN